MVKQNDFFFQILAFIGQNKISKGIKQIFKMILFLKKKI
jgi:hypothetical protein